MIHNESQKGNTTMTSPSSPTFAGESPASALPPKQRKHLMTPGAPPRRPSPNSMSTTQVQKWVMSTLASLTIGHLSGGIVLAALFAPKQSSQIGLLVIAGILGLIAVGAFRLIHQWRLLSPWLLIGLAPTLVGAYFGFWS